MPAKGRGPSIRDVASHAGVSHQTVSRVLNDPTRVRADTRGRVESSIAALGYRRNLAARSLATSASMVIGQISVHSGLFGPTQMGLAIAEECRARGYWTVSVTVPDDRESSFAPAREHLLELGVDGLVLNAWSSRALKEAERYAKRLPICVVADGVVPAGLARARSDNFGGAKAAVVHMVGQGCRRIAHLAGPSDWLEAQQRQRGWQAGGGTGVCVEAGWYADDGYRAADELLRQDPHTDGILAANDNVAIGAIHRLRELRKRVPEDVAVVGFDDIDLAPHLPVPLASVRQPFMDVGRSAVNLLFEVMHGRPPGHLTVAAEFVPRDSAR